MNEFFVDLPENVKNMFVSYISSWNNSKDIKFEKPKFCSSCGSVNIHKHGATNNMSHYRVYDCKKKLSDFAQEQFLNI
ncbi:hypothetical protein ACXYRK_03685 [Mycoplasma sp. AC1221]